MLSSVGKTYDRIRKVQPMNQEQRENSYALSEVKVHPKKGLKKFSPFNTISR